MEKQSHNIDIVRSEMIKRLETIFPHESTLKPDYFSGDYNDFLQKWTPSSASINQFLANGVKRIGVDENEVDEFIETLKERGVTFVREPEFKEEYLQHCSSNVPFQISFYIDAKNVEEYLHLNAEFMFNKIKRYLYND